MYIDKEHFEVWMERIMNRFSRLDKTLDKMGKHRNMVDGELPERPDCDSIYRKIRPSDV